jgi:transcription termination/antitermination protein NusG
MNDCHFDFEPKWYAVHTRSNFEAKLFNSLCGKSITAFLPRLSVPSRRKDRRKKILIPMFPGYLFVQTDLHPETRLELVKTPGLVSLVGISGQPHPLSAEEISNLMILDGTELAVSHGPYLTKGDRVVIKEGPLAGLTGIYIFHKKHSARVVVSIDVLKNSLTVELDDWAVERAA